LKKLIVFLLAFVFLASCNKDNNEKMGIMIKGKIQASNQIKSGPTKSDNPLNLSDAKKVLLFYGSKYSLSDIIDGSFTGYAEMGSMTAMVFLSADNKYIGNLSAGGLNVLPLISLKDGDNTAIDLSTLTLDGDMVIPSHNPLGDEINITAEEIDLFKTIGGYYESLAKNIDADNDGIPDILDDKQITISSLFSTVGGKWGINDTKASVTDPSQFFINYMVLINGGKALTFSNGNISFSGPEGNPYNDISLHGFRLTPDGPQGFLTTFKREFYPPAPGTPEWNVLRPFEKGAYTLTLDGNRLYTLNYSNINCKYYMVLVIPTLHTNSEGKLVSISLEYKLPDNVTTVDPVNILTEVGLQFGNPEMFYNSPSLSIKTGFTNINLSTPLDISSLHHIDIGYYDLLGNQYDIIWQ
jgi:hypothetical protein